MKVIRTLKITSIIFGIIAVLGFVFVLGSVGAMDTNAIGVVAGIKQCLIGIGTCIGGVGISALAANEAEYRERMRRNAD